MSREDLEPEMIDFLHFIRTPLASIKIGGEILKDVFPLLLDIYYLYHQNIVTTSKITSDKRMNNLPVIIDGIIKETKRISEYVQTLEVNK
ncbi:MAG: hypothetical protein WC785_06110 [Tatlockia sp.]|jgi:hypothetical protein